MHLRSVACERTAQFASLRLDGELSLLEREMLGRHLRRCAACTEYARTLDSFTELLRSTPLEEFRLPSLRLTSPRLVPRVMRSVAATAAVAAFGTWFALSYSTAPRSVDHASPINLRSTTSVAVNDGSDWPAGLPHIHEVIQLVPGGLRTAGLTP
jgi:hypothetical protein